MMSKMHTYMEDEKHSTTFPTRDPINTVEIYSIMKLMKHCRAVYTLEETNCPIGSLQNPAQKNSLARDEAKTLNNTPVHRNLARTSTAPVQNRSRKRKIARRIRAMTVTLEYETFGQTANCRLNITRGTGADMTRRCQLSAPKFTACAKHWNSGRVDSLIGPCSTVMKELELSLDGRSVYKCRWNSRFRFVWTNFNNDFSFIFWVGLWQK